MSERCEAELAEILALTDAVQAAIDASDWQGASRIEAERRAKLEALVAASGRGTLTNERLRECLLDAQTESRRLIGEVDHHRRRVLREAETVSTGQRAVIEYEATADCS
jgi:hypothetical protein